MKTKLFTIAISAFIAVSLSFPTEVSARNNNTPSWTNAHKYKVETRQIYFPDYNMYYDRQHGTYIYNNNGKWMVSAELPIVFRNRNLNIARYVEMNIKSNTPQRYNKAHVVTYKPVAQYSNNNIRYADNRYDNKHSKNNNAKYNNNKPANRR